MHRNPISFRRTNVARFNGRQGYTTLMRITYGVTVNRDDDDLIRIFAKALERIVDEGAPGASMIDLFPFRERYVE